MPWRRLRLEEHFELVRVNFVRCEECNEDFFFDFLRHPRYFVAHFKSCHLKNLLYRFNGHSEEENARTRFGPRRKRDATNWFAQLKSTEKRMVSMQDNKWSEISERECWSCRLCNDGKADLMHAFEMSDRGRGQAILHLRHAHERIYEDFLRRLPALGNMQELLASIGAAASGLSPQPRSRASRSADAASPSSDSGGGSLNAAAVVGAARVVGDDAGKNLARELRHRLTEAERSRLRRLQASDEMRHIEALRSKKRRKNLTPAQRQADYERRQLKEKRQLQSEVARCRREQTTDESRERELIRSRERRRNATKEQRQREAERSKRRRENISEEQRAKERERCRRRYEAKKKGLQRERDDADQCLSSNSSRAAGEADHFSDPEYKDHISLQRADAPAVSEQ